MSKTPFDINNEDLLLLRLVDNYTVAKDKYQRVWKKMILLDAADNGRLWQTLGAKFPKYQVLPDTNFISYIKNNLVASIYSVAKSAQLMPTCEEDVEPITNLNLALEYIWDIYDVAYFQNLAGTNAALFNLGITQVGWDVNKKMGKTNYNGEPIFKNISPLKFIRDPFAPDLQHGEYCITWEELHKSVILANPLYHDAFQKFLDAEAKAHTGLDSPANFPATERAPAHESPSGYYRVFMHWFRHDGKICEVHTLDNSVVLYKKDEIEPNRFPFVDLYCNVPGENIVGTSECAKILSNHIAYNTLQSILLTSEYRNQHPPKYVSSTSGLNVASFAKHADDPDYTFIVSQDATKAVHYHAYPLPSQSAYGLQNQILTGVQLTSGIDGRYTGRDTGSVLTTGGMDDMLSRVTLIDMPKIINYERYTKQLTELILLNFIAFSLKRTYFVKEPDANKYTAREVDFSKLQNEALLHYAINISTELPKNKQRIAAMANMLMEKQLQYGTGKDSPDLITPEEWLQCQDLPNKEYMMKRMGIQRTSDATAEVAETLFDFSNLVQSGVKPDQAILATAENLRAKRNGENKPNIVPDDETIAANNNAEFQDYRNAANNSYEQQPEQTEPPEKPQEQLLYPGNV